MKIPLFSNHAHVTSGMDEQSLANGRPQLINLYLHMAENSRHKEILKPFPTPVVTGSALAEKPIRGGVSSLVDGDFYCSGRSVYDGTSNILSTVFNLASTKIQMAHGGGSSYQRILCNDQGLMVAISPSDGTAWQLTDTSLATGIPTSVPAGFLVDTATNFTAAGVKVGMTIKNSDDSTYAFITSITTTTNPNDTLGLSSDVFIVTDTYDVRTSYGLPPSNSSHISYMDGYWLAVDNDNPGRFYISALYDCTRWNALDFATAERSPDQLQAILVVGRQLWMIGDETTEIWWNSGAADFPFQPLQSGLIQAGTQDPNSAQLVGDRGIWVSSRYDSGRNIVMTEGMAVKQIATSELADVLSETSLSTTNFEGTTLSYNDNDFYVLHHVIISSSTSAASENTWCYNLKTGKWNYWSVSEVSGQSFARVILNSGACGGNDTSLYSLQYAVDGQVRKIVSPQLYSDGKNLRASAVELECDQYTMFPYTTLEGAGLLLDSNANFTTLGITTGVDYVVNLSKDVVTGTISAVTPTTLTLNAPNNNPSTNDRYKIIDGVTGDVLYPTNNGITLKVSSGNRSASTGVEQFPTDLNSKLTWYRLGTAKELTFEVSTTYAMDILAAYAIIKTGNREIG